MNPLWAKREEQFLSVIESAASMYGGLQGIAGKGLNKLEGLQVAMLSVREGRAKV